MRYRLLRPPIKGSLIVPQPLKKHTMSTTRHTGMGTRTFLHYRRVANDILNYAQSIDGVDELAAVGDQWQTQRGTRGPIYAAPSSTSYGVHTRHGI